MPQELFLLTWAGEWEQLWTFQPSQAAVPGAVWREWMHINHIYQLGGISVCWMCPFLVLHGFQTVLVLWNLSVKQWKMGLCTVVLLTCVSFLLLHGSHHCCAVGKGPLEASRPPSTQSRTISSTGQSPWLCFCPLKTLVQHSDLKSPSSQWEEGLQE